MREKLNIGGRSLEELNSYLTSPDNPVTEALLKVVEKYGTPEEINRRAAEARSLPNLIGRLKKIDSPYLSDLEWLADQRDKGAFISISEYRARVLGDRATEAKFDENLAVTLEISALQYFPWLISEAKSAIEKGEVLPGRFIRVRNMKEQEKDDGDILAVAAAMQIVGASWVESLDTRGTDGSNIHLGGPETISGYFGGIGQPNGYALKWVDEFLYYYTNYGIQQVLNVNPGTVLLGYLLYRLGVDINFKISVFMGNDNPYAVLWTLLTAKLFSRSDGSTPLAGLNLSNSVEPDTLRIIAGIRRDLGLENKVRIEHHITEPWKHIVRQPYDRRDDLLELAATVPNISAKHEGGDADVEGKLEDPSDILDYFRSKEEILASGDMAKLERDYILKHDAVNRTARALTERGFAFIAASNLHFRQN